MNNVVQASGAIETVRPETIEELKRIALEHPMRRSRLLLHHAPTDPTHEMIIVAHKSTYIRAHRHPAHKSESYHILEGKMNVNIYDDSGAIRDVVRLAADGSEALMIRVQGGTWHEPVPVTEWMVYHEVYSGPFEKSVDVEYASWAPEENRV